MQTVNRIIEGVIPTLQEDFRTNGKEQLLSLKELILQRLKKSADGMKDLQTINKQLRQENDEMVDISEENKTKIEGLEEDLMSKLISENKRFRKILDELEGETHESAKLAKTLITKVVKRDFENQRLWKIKKRLTREMINSEKELFDQMELLFSALVDAPQHN
jgi:cell shape-determining protein MreC